MVTKNRSLKGGINRIQSGQYIKYNSPIISRFGCLQCPWSGQKDCPHGIVLGQKHTNNICSQRALYIQEQLELVQSMPRVIQNEEAIKLKLVEDKMLYDYTETGELHEEFKHINKNLISLIDKMRKQDEGVKVQGELTIAHEDFKSLVEAEAKKIEERNNRTRSAEFREEVQNN